MRAEPQSFDFEVQRTASLGHKLAKRVVEFAPKSGVGAARNGGLIKSHRSKSYHGGVMALTEVDPTIGEPVFCNSPNIRIRSNPSGREIGKPTSDRPGTAQRRIGRYTST